MGGVRGDTAQDDVVFKTILQDFERLVRPEAVVNQNPWFLVRPCSRLGIKHTYESLQADLRVGISRFGARIIPARGGVSGPVASMGCGWSDNHWEERPTICRYALDGSHHHPPDTRAAVISRVVLTYKDFNGAEHA